jgi:polysaccharide export outer membrane protein
MKAPEYTTTFSLRAGSAELLSGLRSAVRSSAARALAALAVTVALAFSPAAQAAQQPGAAAHSDAPQQAAAPATPAEPATPTLGPDGQPLPGMTSDYIIGPGDSIQVFVWRNPELSVSVPVRPDGKVSTPLVEDMIAVGKTPSQLARDIEGRLGEYIRSPQVNIIVVNPQSAFSKITVMGQVRTPGSLPFREGMTVLDAVLASGGLAEFAAGNRTKLVRKDASGKPVEKRVRLDDLIKKGRLKENFDVRPGDVLIVPESRF